MRQRGLLGATAAMVIWACAGAAAQGATIHTELEISGFGFGDGKTHISGNLTSPKRACLPNRTVKMFAITEDGRVPISTDRSSDNGFWGGEGPAEGSIGVKARLLKKNIGPNKVCSADSDRQMFPDFPFPRRAEGTSEYPTELKVDGTSTSSSHVFGKGQIIARRACRSNRRIKIFALHGPGSPELVDLERSSDNGYFGGGGPATDPTGIRFRAPAKSLDQTRGCAMDTQDGIS